MILCCIAQGFPVGSVVKNTAANARDMGLIPGSGKSPGEGNGSLPGSSVHEDSPGKGTGVGLPFPTPGNLPNSGIKPTSLVSPELAGGFFTTAPPWEAGFAYQP